MLQMIRNGWSRWRAYRARLHEFDACASFDLDRMAHDLRMTVPELRQVTASGDSTLLFARLRERGIDPDSINTEILRDLQRCCGTCAHQTVCAHEIEDRPVAAKWPAYCPNQATIDALNMTKCH